MSVKAQLARARDAGYLRSSDDGDDLAARVSAESVPGIETIDGVPVGQSRATDGLATIAIDLPQKRAAAVDKAGRVVVLGPSWRERSRWTGPDA